MCRLLMFLFGWIFASTLRRRAIRTAASDHDTYAHDRVHERKRPGFHADQRMEAILQRAQRELRKTSVRVSMKHVKKILKEG